MISFLKERNIQYACDISLANFSTFKIGGIGKLALFPSSELELSDIISHFRADGKEFIIIGRGSNVLFPDGVFEKPIIFTENLSHIKLDSERVYADAGISLTALSRLAAKHILSGLEFAYGIPGSVGGAVYMNAGAYGSEISEIIESVRVYSSTEETIKTLSAKECDFSYRHSVFQNDPNLTVIGATMRLKMQEDNDDIQSKMKENMASRTQKQPLDMPNAGSVFKRPVGHFAGKLIEDSGLKGYRIGDAEISEKHAGFIVNLGDAKSDDVKALIKYVISTVKEKFGVVLEVEIRIIE